MMAFSNGSTEVVAAEATLGIGHQGSHEQEPRIFHLPKKKHLTNRRSTAILALLTGAILLSIIIVGIFIAPEAMQTDFAQKNLPPSLAHPFGTDWMGRDMLVRTIAGLSLSIRVGLGAALISSIIAVFLASIAALGNAVADAIVNWMTDLLLGIPHIILLILISFALGGGFIGVTVGIALTHWPTLTRVLRAEILQCRQSEYVKVAHALGQSRARIALVHMLPYVLPQYLIGLVLMFPHAILHEAAITFLGFGLGVETPAIGIILSESMGYLSAGMWWLAVFPGLSLIAVVFLFKGVGTGVRKTFDPASAQE